MPVRWFAYADLILPDTTYLERHDCISLLDRPISEPDAVNDAIRWPVVEPDREVRGFQSVLIDLGGRLGLNWFRRQERQAALRRLCRLHRQSRAAARCRPACRLPRRRRKENGSAEARSIRISSNATRRTARSGRNISPLEAQFFKHANAAYQDLAVSLGFFDKPQPVTFQLYCEELQKFRLAAQGLAKPQPPEHLREQVEASFDPLPIWYAPFETTGLGDRARDEFPLYAITQRPMSMYHSWGSQNAWLRQIHTANRLYVPADVCDAKGLKDGDWAWVTSWHGRIKVQVARMDAVNASTLWTWNAIGKKGGAWALDRDAPEATKGFLLNHLISELLPPKGDGLRWANSDPITGQAAWYDLRVNIEKAEAGAGVTEPVFEPQHRVGAGGTSDELRYGEEWNA